MKGGIMRYLKITIPIILVAIVFFGCPKKQVVKPVEPVPEETVVVPKETTVVETRPQLVLERIFFDFDKSDIRKDAAETLKKNAEMLKLYPEVKVTIEGHCCEIGTAEYNMALGERRAKSARDYLIMLGISPDRLSTVSYGEERPLDPKVLEKNRRCEFVIMK
ncbi:MAG: OmpA family protein [candidate division WOR-3 bacterium]|nr:OmpA family protein [candidate division WOR-3 bacterium]